MAISVALIVTDAPPLITLAAAQSLDDPRYPGLPAMIPDAVFHAATAAAGELGAQEMLLREALPGRRPARDLGERAAIEVIRNTPLAAHGRALLLSDDRDAERLPVFEPEKAILLTTWDYSRQLEEAGRIQWADLVMQAVREAGRNPPRRDLWSGHDPDIRAAVRAVIDQAHDGADPEA